MNHFCLRLSRPRSIRIPAATWLAPIIFAGSLSSIPAFAQDEPNVQPPANTITGQGIAPHKIEPSFSRSNTPPAGLGESMWGPAMDPPSRKETRWYGWQQMIPLVSAEIAFIASWAEKDFDAIRASLVYGPAVHLFAGPIVHWAHGHFDKGVAAFALNLFIPGTALLLAGAGYEARVAEFELLAGFIGGGFLAAQAIDIVYLSRETVRVPLESARQPRSWLPSSVALLPLVDSNMRGLMLTGQF